MPPSDELIAQIFDIIETELEWPVEHINLAPDTLLGHGLSLDSVMIIELAVCIEKRFKISLPDAEILDLGNKSIWEAAQSIQERIVAGSTN